MRCCVPSCNTSSDSSESTSQSNCVTFHNFPSEMHLRVAWLRALGKQDSRLPDSAVVCSQHFLNDDIYETENGRQIYTGAIPSTVLVCMICLDTDSKLVLMSKHQLDEAYETLTGQPLCDQGNLKQTLCVQCARRLINFSRFRDNSLRARALMMDLVKKHEIITRQHIKMINRTKHQLKSNNMVLTTLGPDHCDLYILESPTENKQTKLEETEHRVEVKVELCDDSMFDEDMGVISDDDNNVNDFVPDPLKYEIAPFQCTLCLEEFVYEHAYMQHMNMHLQNRDSDDECDTSQVCKPHTAVSSSTSQSSLITENKLADPSSEAHASQTLVVPPPASLATNNDIRLTPAEEAHTDRNKKFTDCAFNLHNVFTKKVVSRQVDSIMKTRKAVRSCVDQNIASKDVGYQATSQNVSATEYFEPVTNTKVVKLEPKTSQNETDRLNNFDNVQCNNNSVQNSLLTGKISFICDICQKVYKRKKLLDKHIKTHIGERCCRICKFKCKHKGYLKEHMKSHMGEMPYTCSICHKKFARKNYLAAHTRTHTEKKSFICDICDKKFALKCYLVAHIRSHTGEKPFTCTICNNKFSRKGHLGTHMRIHTGEQPYSCKVCNKKFARNNQLVYHMKSHTGEKPYVCEICDARFAHRWQQVLHVRAHTGEKPFTCMVCSKKFSRNGFLVMHMRIHTGVKPISCKICNKRFGQNSELVSHMRVHTGEKPFTCGICDTKFAYRCQLKKHNMRTHTGEKP